MSPKCTKKTGPFYATLLMDPPKVMLLGWRLLMQLPGVLWLSVLRGVVKPLMLMQLRDRFPRYLWSSLPYLAKGLRTFWASATPDAQLLFCSSIAGHMLGEPAISQFRDAMGHDPAAFRLIFSHQKPLSLKPDFKTAAG